MKKYKIDFIKIFIFSLLIMIFNEIWVLLESVPAIMPYGDIIYYIIKSVLSILTQLAIGIATGVIFYYIVEFLNKKKNHELYTDLRRDVLFICYAHLELLSKTTFFKRINERKRLTPNLFDIYDIPILVDIFMNDFTEDKVDAFKKEVLEYLATLGDTEVNIFVKRFEIHAQSMLNKKEFRYFKESKDLIETVDNCYNDEFALGASLYIFEKDEENRKCFLITMGDDYYNFLKSTIELYIELDKFIECLEKKKFWTFLHMLD